MPGTPAGRTPPGRDPRGGVYRTQEGPWARPALSRLGWSGLEDRGRWRAVCVAWLGWASRTQTLRMRASLCIARSMIALPDRSTVWSLTISFGIDGPNIRSIGKRFFEVRWKTLPPYLAMMKADR
jgi:hypothetical protein